MVRTADTTEGGGRVLVARRAVHGAAGLAGALACVLWLAEQVRFLRSGQAGPPGELALSEVGVMLAASVAVFSFDTVVLVAVAGTLVALRPGSRAPALRWLLLAALLSATMSAVLYQLLVAPGAEWSGLLVGFDVLAHYVAPALLVLGWLVTGPRLRSDVRLLGLVLLWPAGYLGYLLVAGRLTGAYAYDFLDPGLVGATGVAVVVLALLVVAVVLGGVLVVLDRTLRRPAAAGAQVHPQPRTGDSTTAP